MEPGEASQADARQRDSGTLQQLRDPKLWIGGDYELGLAMPPHSLSIPTRLRLLRALWDDQLLTGVVRDEQQLGEPWLPVDTEEIGAGQLYGCLRIGERLVGCRTLFLDLADEAWCQLCIPMGMVEQIYSVDYGPPGGLDLSDEDNPWRKADLDPLLAHIAGRVYAKIPFELGVLGWETTDDSIVLDELMPDFVKRQDPRTGLIVPDALFARFGLRPHGLQVGERVWWTGANGG